jgi:hypothetical protein
MATPPRIWLDYRPVRIGWVIDEPEPVQLAEAGRINSCLWGGRFNPVIPCRDTELAQALIKVFGVDVLLPVRATEATTAFIGGYPHLHLMQWWPSIFHDKRCAYVDVHHAVRRAASDGGFPRDRLIRPVWSPDDPLGTLLPLMFGGYPEPAEITIDYLRGIRASIPMPDYTIAIENPFDIDLFRFYSPLTFSGFDLSVRRERSGWRDPGFVMGDIGNFDDLLLFWNLRAAGAEVWFYDSTHSERLKPFAEAFLSVLRERPAEAGNRVSFWIRTNDIPAEGWKTDLDVTGLQPTICRAADAGIWNGLNLRPIRPEFSAWHRDVVANYAETDERTTASFALPDRPCLDDDPQVLDQRYVVTVDAQQYGSGLDDRTFATPFLPELNEFYGRNFHFEYDHARAEPGSFGRGAVGIISSIGTQQLQINALRIQDWLKAFFGHIGVEVQRSEPGRRCSRLIRQIGGLQACRVFKVRGARELIGAYGPDQSFTRGAAERKIGDFDEVANRMRFADFEHLHIQPRERGNLTPGEVFQYLTARGVFRPGLEFRCPNCELTSWIQLDDVATLSTCLYCGHRFDVTSQLKDRDWRYRRSGLFGRDDHQLGGIPVALTLQQLATALRDRLLMYATALEFRPGRTAIEPCESDFLAVVAGSGREEHAVQLLFGEVKTHSAFDANDVRKLGQLADAIPRELGEGFIMFAKTDHFTDDEIALTRTLNGPYRRRVILWSQDELEPFHVYERSEAKLGQRQYATTLSDMASVTEQLWFQPAAPVA